MAMICPQCGKSYEQRLQCQLCGIRLVYHDLRRGGTHFSGSTLRWRQTNWGRVAIGVFLAQGLFYALRQLLTGALLGLQGEGSPQGVWGTPTGIVLLQALCLGAVFAGATLAGSGRANGMLLGAFVGLFNGALWGLQHGAAWKGVSRIELLGQPLLQAAVGLVAGWFACTFWRPLPALGPSADLRTQGKRASYRLPLFAGRVAWPRVVVGVTVAVAGAISAAALFDLALDASAGALSTSDEMQDRFITWEIKALALLLGGALAGSTTRNGLKQGLVVGIGTSVILAGIEMARFENWLPLVGLTMVSTFSLTIAGGWFGSTLFPPVVKFSRRSFDAAV